VYTSTELLERVNAELQRLGKKPTTKSAIGRVLKKLKEEGLVDYDKTRGTIYILRRVEKTREVAVPV